MTTGEKIKQARTAAGLTQKDLAARLEIVPNTISQYENGTRKPKIETLRRIASAIGCQLSDLIGDDMKISKEDRGGLDWNSGSSVDPGDIPADPERVREDEKTLLQYYRKLEDERKGKVLDYVVDQYGSQTWERTAPEDGPGHIQNL